jgi:hypothetical protein
MKISAKVIEDSIEANGKRITTLQLCYPRFIHSEFMTHRVFSRNASSSRAIPVMKMLAQVWNDPAMPIHWGANQPGMQAHSQLGNFKKGVAKFIWRSAGKVACVFAWGLNKLGLHKQVANRILEPWQNIQVVVTGTEWNNFFELRDHEDAQPEIHELAIQIKDAMGDWTPRQVEYRGSEIDQARFWHLPYVTQQERHDFAYNPMLLVKFSAARCARVSYLLHDGARPNLEKDLTLYERLVGSSPLHASPIEHQATPTKYAFQTSNNFKSWQQFRAMHLTTN